MFFLPLFCVLVLTDLPCAARWASVSVLAEKTVGAESTWNFLIFLRQQLGPRHMDS